MYTNTRVFWYQTIEGHKVEFSNTPFTVSAIRKLDCQFGTHYYKEHQGKPDRTRLQGTRKIGCQAHIIVRTITVYPEFQLSDVDVADLGARKLKEKKKEKLAQLQNAIALGEPFKTNIKYHILLPTEEAHHSFQDTLFTFIEVFTQDVQCTSTVFNIDFVIIL